MPGSEAQLRRFVRALVKAGSAIGDGSGAYSIQTGPVRALLSRTDAKSLAAQGVVRIETNICRPTGASSDWLRHRPKANPDRAVQHRMLAAGPHGTTRDLAHHPLLRLAQATGDAFLEPHHLAAGERVCRWGQRAQLRQRVTMSYDPAQVGGRRRGGGGADIADMAVEARKSIARLYAELPRDCAETIVDVCVFEKGLQTIEAERGWPRRSAKLVLRIGLDQLAARLGLAPSATGHPSGRVTAWLGESFEPTRFE